MITMESYISQHYGGMQCELNRLASFDKWPNWVAKRPIALAEAGFFYTGDQDHVICFSCNGEIGNWTTEDDVKEQHKKRYPSCEFMNGQETKNVQFEVVMEASISAAMGTDRSSSREGSFEEQYAAASMYGQLPNHNSTSPDILTAATTTVNDWHSVKEELDELFDELKSLDPRESSCGDRTDSYTSQVSELGTGCMDSIHLNFGKHESYRLHTFKGHWPPNSFISPADLAKAGFYYVGQPDKVQCAFCRGQLLNWKSFSAMSEHRRHYPGCPFIRGRNVGNIPAEECASIVQIPHSQHDARSSLLNADARKQKNLWENCVQELVPTRSNE